MKLNLACGNDYKEGFVNVDWTDSYPTDVKADILTSEYWDTLADESVEEVLCFHFLEHIPHQLPHVKKDGLIWFLEQVWRVCRDGATLEFRFPYYQSGWAFGDPTHCRFLTNVTFQYFDALLRAPGSTLPDYGIEADFEIRQADLVVIIPESVSGTSPSPVVMKELLLRQWNHAQEERVVLVAHKPMRTITLC